MNDTQGTAGARQILVATALFYPLAVIVVLVLVIRDDPWIMFSITYRVLAFGAMPLVWMLGTFLRARKFGHLPWVWVLFHLALVAMATFGRFYLMVEFSAGV